MKKLKPKIKAHCYRVACICDEISAMRGLSEDSRYDAVWAGLLHDIIKNRSEEDHAEIGKIIADDFLRLGKNISQAIGSHNSEEEEILEKNKVAKIVFIADKIDKQNKRDYPPNIKEKFEELSSKVLDIDCSLDECIKLWFCIKKEIKKIKKA